MVQKASGLLWFYWVFCLFGVEIASCNRLIIIYLQSLQANKKRTDPRGGVGGKPLLLIRFLCQGSPIFGSGLVVPSCAKERICSANKRPSRQMLLLLSGKASTLCSKNQGLGFVSFAIQAARLFYQVRQVGARFAGFASWHVGGTAGSTAGGRRTLRCWRFPRSQSRDLGHPLIIGGVAP
jgi:hypothetical protein